MSEFLDIFGKVFVTSGGLGIDGKGYWYDKLLELIPGYSFKNTTFIAKTVTIDARDGNLPLDENLQPISRFPKCVKFYPFHSAMMNAVGISNPGLAKILEMGIWQERTDPFLISIMPVKSRLKGRLRELRKMVKLIEKHSSEFKAVYGIQLNISCPNVGKNLNDYMKETIAYLELLQNFRYLDIKVNVLFPPESLANLSTLCSIVTCSNSIPFGAFPDKINWDNYRGLEEFGGGGLSGKPLLPFVTDWIKRARTITDLPIKACGGIISAGDVTKVYEAGANAIELGSVKVLRPWRVKSIVKAA